LGFNLGLGKVKEGKFGGQEIWPKRFLILGIFGDLEGFWGLT